MEVSYATKIAKRKYFVITMETRDITYLEQDSKMYGRFIYKVDRKNKTCHVIPLKIIKSRAKGKHIKNPRDISYKYFRNEVLRYCFKIITEEKWRELSIMNTLIA